ncbi:MAG: methionine--tRNA ligase [Actinobacteria bacterium]|nr:methionine--tRNA ligase [Actinomycetota bacterium]
MPEQPGRFYVTTPIYYVNDAPHAGHAYATVTADALARWHRLLGDDVFFLTGTDEHGLKVQRSADAAGRTPQQQADVHAAHFADAWRLLDVSNDDFIRTSEARHHAAVQALLQKVYDRGYIYADDYSGLYCVACEEYYTADELDENPDADGLGLCPIHHRPVESFSERNWFFRLSEFAEPLAEHYRDHPEAVQPEGKRNETLGLIRQGLRDISISRSSIDWGVPIPWDPSQVFYVWYDALINYATAIGYGTDRTRFDAWWPNVHHVIGKDILRFHCVYWPALLMAAGEAPPAHVHVHGFLLVGGEKMSKSGLTQITPAELVDEFGVDGVRHHLLHDLSFGPDGDFSEESMIARYNADLANNLGNLLSRVATVLAKKSGGIGTAPRPDSPLAAVAGEVVAQATAAWEAVTPSVALDATWRLIREANALLEATEPWKADPGAEVDAVLGDALEVLRIVAVLASPAVPDAAQEIWRRIGCDGSVADRRVPVDTIWGAYVPGRPVLTGDPLFPRIKASGP